MEDSKNYKSIFKSTFLFGFVRVFGIMASIIRNKIVALLLGAEGIGVIGIYDSTINLLKTGAGLGISQSAIRDISEANGLENLERLSLVISVTKKIILFTALFGCIITIILSPWLSEWTLGNKSYILIFIYLSVIVGINILIEGQLAILKGMRQLNSLARASLIGSVAGLISAVPMYYFFGKQGIIPSLFATALTALFFSNSFVRKIKYDRQKLSFKKTIYEAKPMIQMGIALMLVSFLGFLSELVIASYITRNGGLEVLGCYKAGITIITGYFGVITTALTTDYYPRIAAIHNDNIKLNEEFNRQSRVSLVIVFPLAIIFLFLSSIFVNILYSEEFGSIVIFVDFALFASIITLVSNCMGMILLAKQKASVFIWSVLLQNILMLFIFIFLYKFYGLLGLGIGHIIMAIISISLQIFIMYRLYRIRFNAKLIKNMLFVLFFTVLTFWTKKINYVPFKFSLGFLLLLISSVFSIKTMKLEMGIDIFKIMRNRIIKK